MKIGIAFVPYPETIKSIVELQNKIISIYPLQPVLGTEFNLPHITLLQGRFRKTIYWSSLLTDLRNYCETKIESLNFEIIGIEYKSPNWYFLKLRENYLFLKAHEFVFNRLSPLMFLAQEDFQKDISSYSNKEKLNFLRYGYRYIGECFYPHFTLGKSNITLPGDALLNSIDLLELGKLNLLNLTGKVQKITVYAIGEDGSHAKTLYYLNL